MASFRLGYKAPTFKSDKAMAESLKKLFKAMIKSMKHEDAGRR